MISTLICFNEKLPREYSRGDFPIFNGPRTGFHFCFMVVLILVPILALAPPLHLPSSQANQMNGELYEKKVLWSEKAVAFSGTKKSRELIRIYDKQIVVLFESGELARIYKNWNQPFYPEYWQK